MLWQIRQGRVTPYSGWKLIKFIIPKVWATLDSRLRSAVSSSPARTVILPGSLAYTSALRFICEEQSTGKEGGRESPQLWLHLHGESFCCRDSLRKLCILRVPEWSLHSMCPKLHMAVCLSSLWEEELTHQLYSGLIPCSFRCHQKPSSEIQLNNVLHVFSWSNL